MSRHTLNRRTIIDELNKQLCPHRLYPQAILALEVFVQESIMTEIYSVIVNGLTRVAGEAFAEQFLRDFQTYGLHEAIVYFHTYDFTKPQKVFFQKVFGLYHYIARLFMHNYEEIMSSDDPRIQVQLDALRAMGGLTTHLQHMAKHKCLEPPEKIPSPAEPKQNLNYRRQLPIHDDLAEYMSALGGDELPPVNLTHELLEHLCAQFMFEGFPGLALVFHEAVNLIQEHGIKPFTPEGQFILASICDAIKDEMFGDVDTWVYCIDCGRDFIADVRLRAANRCLIDGGWRCQECLSKSDPIH